MNTRPLLTLMLAALAAVAAALLSLPLPAEPVFSAERVPAALNTADALPMPDRSPFPAPQVDTSAPTPEPAPTF